MVDIDRQRITAVNQGYAFDGMEWQPVAGATVPSITTAADALHARLVMRADALARCSEGSDEERELAAITDAIEAYEAVRWGQRATSRVARAEWLTIPVPPFTSA